MDRRTLAKLMMVSPLTASIPVGVAAAQDEKVELTFRQFDPPGEIGGLEAAIAVWNEANPNIQVKLETVTGAEAQPQFVREVQAGGGPDIEHLAFVWTRDLAEAGLLMPLDDLIASSPLDTGIDDFLALDLAKYQDKIYGIPWTADTIVMSYRPDLFETAGISAFPDTWEDLQAVAQQLTVDTDGNGRTDQYGFCFPAGSGADSGMWFLANYYLWSNGATLLQQSDAGEWELGVTEEQVAEAMTYFNGFFEQGSTPESLIAINSWGDPEITGGLARGDCAISFMPPQTFRTAQAQSDAPLMTAAVPRGSETRISHLGGRALGINPNTEHPDQAWEFLKFLTTVKTFETYNQYPAQKTVLDELDFPEEEQGYVEMLPQAITFERYISSPIPVPTLQETLNRSFGAVYSGQFSPEEASAELISELTDLLAREAE